MFIVVESGSTKADWMVVSDGVKMAYNTKGFNPYFHNKEDILLELHDHLELDLIKDKVEQLFFYGAGCSSPHLNQIIEKGLSAFFTKAKILVNHDLAASAYACYSGKPEIACILGTGSNSCFYDGSQILEEVPALSYVLGDEGSGCYLGKQLLSDYLYKRLPDSISSDLEAQQVTKEVIFENVYRKPDANVYIASFMKTLIHYKNLSYSQRLITSAFQSFIDVHVKCFANYREVEVNFVGSVASLLQDELYEVCEKNGIQIGRIIRRPLEYLVEYHEKLAELEFNNPLIKKIG
jgi:glucosamine kinase